jgi:hypothetical protein
MSCSMPNLKNVSNRQLHELLQSLTDCDGVLEQTELAQEAQNELLTRPNCFRIRPDYFDADFDKAIAFLGKEDSEIAQSL